MAVFTTLEREDIEQVVAHYGVGQVVSFEAIGQGIENTNYFVDTQVQGMDGDEEKKRWVLTVLEQLDRQALPYFSNLTTALVEKGFSVSAPINTVNGDMYVEVKGKPAVLVPRLSGTSTTQPNVDFCERIGKWLGQMHLALCDYPERRSPDRDLAWIQNCTERLQDCMKEAEWAELNAYVGRYRAYEPELSLCPKGTVHGDLFRDNVLFRMGHVSGVIDFYHACCDVLLYDLAVVANDWCIHLNMGRIGSKHKVGSLEALLEGYQSVRAWNDQEKKMWPYCLELAALRFWLSRLMSKHFPGYQGNSEDDSVLKNPDEMKSILYGLARPKEKVML